MKKSVPQRLNKKPLIALAIILFGVGIAYFTNAAMNKREGLEGQEGDIPAPPVPTASPPPGTPGHSPDEEEEQ